MVKLDGKSFHVKIVMEWIRQQEIFKEAHGSAMGAHSGEVKTYEKIRERFYWPNMSKDIKQWVNIHNN